MKEACWAERLGVSPRLSCCCVQVQQQLCLVCGKYPWTTSLLKLLAQCTPPLAMRLPHSCVTEVWWVHCFLVHADINVKCCHQLLCVF
ncbi:hypothetical protein GBAR_LOCUS25731, partial [Geodia barretti]